MTVQECLTYYIGRGCQSAWMCPNCVDDISFRISEYTATIPIRRKLDPRLANAKVSKHWKEASKECCICYDYQAVKPFSIDIYRPIDSAPIMIEP